MGVNESLVQRGLERMELELSLPKKAALIRYIEELELWNPAYGLVNASGDDLVIRHILDSLSAVSLMRGMPHGRIADLGSGAGLPGIPVALALPESQVTLVERMGKRVGFLENQKALLGLDSITIMEREVERVSGLFDIITFRAFRPFSEAKLFKTIGKLLAPGGSIIAYKGRHETAAAELSASAFGANPGRVIPVEVPFLDEERCLVVIQQSGS